LVQLQKGLDKIRATGTQVVGISYDSVDTLSKFAKKRKISFPLLSDEGSKTIDAYGIRNTRAKPGSIQDGIPYPGTFLVDQNGVVRDKLFLKGYVRRHSNRDLIEAAKKID